MQSILKRLDFDPFQWLCLAVIAAAFLFTWVFDPSMVRGQSMEPTFYDGDRVFVDPFTPIERGDCIVLKFPGEDADFLKRVIGIPGDEIYIINNRVYLNGKLQHEPYIKNDICDLPHIHSDAYYPYFDDYVVEVKEGYYFLLGDNRRHSGDSRDYGAVSFEDVYGIAVRYKSR